MLRINVSLTSLFLGLIFTLHPFVSLAEEGCETVEGIVSSDTGTSTKLIWRMAFVGCFYDEIAKQCSSNGSVLRVKNDGDKEIRWFSFGLTAANGYTLKPKSVEYIPLSYYRKKGDKVVIPVSVTKCKDINFAARTGPQLPAGNTPALNSGSTRTPAPATPPEPSCQTYKGKVSWTGVSGNIYINTSFWGTVIDPATGKESPKGGVLRVKNNGTKDIRWYSPGLTAVNGYTLAPGKTEEYGLSIYTSKNSNTWIQVDVDVTVCK